MKCERCGTGLTLGPGVNPDVIDSPPPSVADELETTPARDAALAAEKEGK